MPLEYSEVQATGISQTEFNTIFNSTKNIKKQALVYRYLPEFNNNIGVLGRASTVLWSAAASSDGIVRVFISAGHLFAEQFTGTWSSTTDLGAVLDIKPKVIYTGSQFEVYYVNTSGLIKVRVSATGSSWGSASSFSTVTLPTDGTLKWIAYGGQDLPTAYAVIEDTSGSQKISAIDSTTQYDTGIIWPTTLRSFDCEYILSTLDDSVNDNDTDVRHVLVASTFTPSIYTFKTVDGLPKKIPIPTGGIISWIIRPPNSGRDPQCTWYYPVHLSDNTNVQDRFSAYLTPCNSFNASELHDTLFAVAYGQNGDVNAADTSYTYNIIAYYSTRDGKHWTQDRLVDISDIGGTTPDLTNGIQIVKYGANCFLITSNGLIGSPGCLEWNNPDENETVDITNDVLSYSSSVYESRQTNIELTNRDGKYNNTILTDGITCALVVKFGDKNYKFQVSLEEIDSIRPARELPRSVLQISSRDKMAWLSDRSQSADAIQWDNQIISRDNFIDIGGVQNSGLAHTATVAGSFKTASNTLVAISKFKECIAWNTAQSDLADGHASVIFRLPDPTGPNPSATSTDSPTYAGVVFRAIDKDNLWYCRYNFWATKIELIERRAGSDTVVHDYTPDGTYISRATGSGVGIWVEFKGSRIRVWLSDNNYAGLGGVANGGQFFFAFEYISPAFSSFDLRWYQGYTGYISSGYSDEDAATGPGFDSPPDPVDIATETAFGPMDSFVPTRLLMMNLFGGIYRGAGDLTSTLSWTDISMGGGIITSLAGGSVDLRHMAIVDATQDPFDATRVLIVGSYGIAKLVNPFSGSATYTDLSVSPQANYTFGYVGGGGDYWKWGKIEGSINVQGYFGWLEIPDTGHAGSNVYYCYTTDNFASIHRTDTGIAYPYGGGNERQFGMTIGDFASSVSNIHIWISGNGTTKYSTNGGASFSSYTYTQTFYGFPGGGINMPFSLPGGGNNTSYANLMAIERGDNLLSMYVHGKGSNETSPGTPFNHGTSTRDIQTLTIDCNYIATILGGSFALSQDGGATWSVFNTSVFPAGTIFYEGLNGWPTNPNFYVVWHRNNLRITVDGGTTFTNPMAAPADDNGCVVAFADFSEVYPVGGVHP